MNSSLAVPPVSMSARYGYIPCFDGLRSLAIVLVILRHLEVSNIIPAGFGVTVFFFISGVLITRLLLAEQVQKGGVDLFNFYIRRFVRLAPPLIVMVGITSIVMVANGVYVPWQGVASSLLYFRNYYTWYLKATGQPLDTEIWEPTWSLAVEEHFYLLFPLVLVFFGSRPRIFITAMSAACVGSLVLRILAWFYWPEPDQYLYHATEMRLDGILTGCLLSYVAHYLPNASFWKYISSQSIFWFCVMCIPASMLYREAFYDGAIKYSVQQLLLIVIMYQMIFIDSHQWAKVILENGFLKYIGRLSYSLYLWHLPCYYAVKALLPAQPHSVQVIISIAAAFVVAAMSYHLLEMPLVSMRKKFGAHVPKTESEPEGNTSVYSSQTNPSTN
jgi:peptidoglycan/LPS O-acetylase OafA/YrhL